ncbi:18.5 kDa class I heat shock protein, partial [Mucuna pruriens]
VDWKETPEAHVFKADIPGLKKEEVKVHIEDDTENSSPLAACAHATEFPQDDQTNRVKAYFGKWGSYCHCGQEE